MNSHADRTWGYGVHLAGEKALNIKYYSHAGRVSEDDVHQCIIQPITTQVSSEQLSRSEGYLHGDSFILTSPVSSTVRLYVILSRRGAAQTWRKHGGSFTLESFTPRAPPLPSLCFYLKVNIDI